LGPAKIKDDIKLINADFKEEKRTGNLILSNNRKKTSLLKNNLKEQKKFLK
jgi:hypothetical protein